MNPAAALRRAMVARVRGVLHDPDNGLGPIRRSVDPFLPRNSVAWRVHGDVTTMMVGGVTALLFQMLHPSARAGVWDHSDFQADLIGRLRRTARFIAVTTYGERQAAAAAIAHVRHIHEFVHGVRPDGVAYSAETPRLLAWVHVAGAMSFLDAWIRFGEPRMSAADQDLYFAEVAAVAEALGADPVPRTRADAEALINAFRSELDADDRSRRIAQLILHPPGRGITERPVWALTAQAAIDLLPPWARAMHGLHASRLARPAVSSATFGMASALRWAFAGA